MRNLLSQIARTFFLITTVLLIPAASADVQLRIVNYLPAQVSGVRQPLQTDTASWPPLPIASNGSAVTETSPGVTWVFRSAGKEIKRHLVTSEAVQTVVLGERPRVERTFINDSSVDLVVSSVFRSTETPRRLMKQKLFELSPQQKKTMSFYFGNVIRFEAVNKVQKEQSASREATDQRVAPDYVVKRTGQSDTFRIRAVVARTVYNYLTDPLEIRFTSKSSSNSSPREAEKLSAKRRMQLLVSPGWKLSFHQNGKPVREDYVVSDHRSGDIRIGLSPRGSSNVEPEVRRPSTNENGGDADWDQWVRETGPPGKFPQNDELEKSYSLFGHGFPGIEHCTVGYNVLKMDPRDLQSKKGTLRRHLFQTVEQGDRNWRMDNSEAVGLLLPNYLRVVPIVGGLQKQTRLVYTNESEHMNAWSSSLGIIAQGASVGANFNHSRGTEKSSTTIRNQDFTIHWRDWAVIHKPGIRLDPEFAERLLGLRDADKREFARFFEEYGTHYPVATLFGGIRSAWGESDIVASRVSETTGWNVSVGPQKPKEVTRGLSASLGNSNTSTSGTSRTRESGGSESSGTLDNDRAAAVPIRVILAPISELVRPQLLKGSDLAVLRASIDAAYDSYKAELSRSEQSFHRVFRVVARCQAVSNSDSGSEFELRNSSAHLHYFDVSDAGTPTYIGGYPRQILKIGRGSDNEKDIKPGQDIFNDTSNIVVSAQHLDAYKLALQCSLEEDDPTRTQHLSVVVPDSAFQSLMGMPAETTTATAFDFAKVINAMKQETYGKYDPKTLAAALTDGGVSFRTAMELRTWTEKIRKLAEANDVIRKIETTRPTNSAAAGRPAATFYDDPERDRIVDARTLDERISRASERGLTEYTVALRRIKELLPKCRQQSEKSKDGIGKLRFSLQIADVTHLNPRGIRFPEPPITNSHVLVDATSRISRDAE